MSSTSISAIRVKRHQEQEYTRQQLQLRQMKASYEKKIKKIVSNNETKMKELNKTYRLKLGNLDSELQKKLLHARNHQTLLLKDEQERLETELSTIKLRHSNQLNELNESNIKQISDMNEQHEDILENIKAKFLKTKSKWEFS